MEPDPIEDDGGIFDDPDFASDDEAEALDPREAARDRRRDHDAEAHARELMRPGMGKVFKQITDTWSRDTPSRPPKSAKHR